MNANTSSRASTRPDAAAGPLVVSRANPRYFAIRSGDAAERRVVYLTGSHIWNNFHDGMGPGSACAATPERFDYDAYLEFLTEHGHNFIRLWRWENFRSQAAGGSHHLCMTPQPWARTGPGTAKDGRPKFDLSKLDQAYFDRVRERVAAAGARGIYVAVMLFDGWPLHLSPAPDNIEGHPFHAANNVNGIAITSVKDYQVLPLDPRVQALQEAYITKVVDAVHDLPNVLYEVSNESPGGGSGESVAKMLGLREPPDWGNSTEWQYWVIDVVKRYEREKGYDRHPIGMTMQFPVADQRQANAPLYASRADWISPGYDDEIFARGRHPMTPGAPPSRWLDDPPAADGRKVVLNDTDHYAPPDKVGALWAWKAFLRGHNTLLMDFGLIAGTNPPDPSAAAPGTPSYAFFEPIRYAMGDTLRYAQKMSLIGMEPRGDLSSTGYALADPGEEYFVLQPSASADPFTVELTAGTYEVEWYGVAGRETMQADKVGVGSSGPVSFTAPFARPGPAVLYLKRAGR